MPNLFKRIVNELRPVWSPAPIEIEGINPASWDSPLQPIRPLAPSADFGFRQYDFTPGQNLVYTPRGDQRVTFQQLRTFAASFDLCAMVLDKKKREIGSKKWQIRVKPVPGEKKGDYKGREQKATAEVERITNLFRFPDGHHSFQQWSNMWLDDVLVCDAGSILPVRNKLGDIFQLRVISGSTITPLLDEQGFVPAPPSPAYQQIILGLPTGNLAATNAQSKKLDLTADQLIYRPRNPRPYTRWGCSPVERIIVTLDIASRRQRFLLDYYTEGTVPEGFIFAQEGWTPDQIKQFQTWLDDMLAGNLARRRRIIVAPPAPGSGKGVEWAKQSGLTDQTEDYLTKLVCYCFDESPQNLIKQMNRASAEKSAEVSKEAGEVSLAAFCSDQFNYILEFVLEVKDLEFVWAEEEDVDPAIEETILASQVASGRITRNESRERQGLDPVDEPNANVLTITAGATVMLLSMVGQEPAGPAQQGESQSEDSKGAAAKALSTNHAEFKGHDLTNISDGARAQMEGSVARFLRVQGDRLAKTLPAAYGKVRKLKKADDDKADKIIQDADLSWFGLVHEIAPDMLTAAEEGVVRGASQMLTSYGANAATVRNAATSHAKTFAIERAAELVGMRYDEEGKLIQNPNAQWAISETTRDGLKKQITQAFSEHWSPGQLATAIEQSDLFSTSRAEMIAKTEIARSQSFGNLQSWIRSGYILETKWQTSADHKCCDNCDGYAAKGSVPAGYQYAKGIVAPPDAHPNCECALVVTKVKK